MTNDIFRAVIRLGIDYFRWTQLVPMLTGWAFLSAVVLAIAFTSFETQGMAALEAIFAIVGAIYRLLPDRLTERAADGSIDISGDVLAAVATWAWLALSALAMAINWLVGERLRPAFLATLSGRIKTAGVAAACIGFLLLLIRVGAPENFNDSLTAWLPLIIGGPLLVWLLSVYSLSVSAVLSAIEAGLESATAEG